MASEQVACAKCGTLGQHKAGRKGKKVCDECKDEKKMCGGCGQLKTGPQFNSKTGENKKVCQSCHREENKKTCDECGKEKTDVTYRSKTDERKRMCRGCHGKENRKKCDECGKERADVVHKSKTDERKQICQTCHRKEIGKKKCDGCGKEKADVRYKSKTDENKIVCGTCHGKELGKQKCDACGEEKIRGREFKSKTDDKRRICHACQRVDEDMTRRRGRRGRRGGRDVYDHTCTQCGTHDDEDGWPEDSDTENDSDIEEELCLYCDQRQRTGGEPRLHASAIDKTWHYHDSFELMNLAIRNSVEMNPEDASSGIRQPTLASKDYTLMTQDELRSRCRIRGVKLFNSPTAILANRLQINDALNGILPRVSTSTASVYHRMRSNQVIEIAQKRGAPSAKTIRRKLRKAHSSEPTEIQMEDDANAEAANDQRPPTTSAKDDEVDQSVTTQLYINWLLQNDEEEDHKSWQLIKDDASQAAITEALSADLGTLIGLRPTEQLAYRQMMQNPIEGPLHETYEGALRGTDDVLQDLDLTIYRGEYPTVTLSTGLLNGPRAVATSLNTRRLGRPDLWDGFEKFSDEDVMSALFTSHGADTPTGTPTPQYEAWIRNQSDQHGIGYDALRADMLRSSNLSALQLQAALDLLYETGRLPYRAQLGVLASSHLRTDLDGQEVREAASAHIIGGQSLDRMTIWVHNNIIFGRGRYNHFEGFSQDGSPDGVFTLGLRSADSGEYSRVRFKRMNPLGISSPEHEEAASRRNAQAMKSRQAREAAKKCMPCRVNNRTCGGRPGQLCYECALGDDPKACWWPPHLPEWKKGKKLSEVTPEDIVAWDRPNIHQDERVYLARQHEAEVEPEQDYILCAFFGRKSGSDIKTADIDDLLEKLAQNRHMYDVLLGSPAHANEAAAQRPGGIDTPIRGILVPFVRHGGKLAPSQSEELLDPFLSAFLELLEEVCDPDHEQKPIEIHLVTNGLAGMCSGVERWQELYDFVASLDKDLADKIYIVPVVEPFLVDGVDPAALNSGSNTLAPGWTGYRHKYVQKNRLRDVLDCYEYNEATMEKEVADAIAEVFGWDNLPSFDAFPQFAPMTQAERDAYITQLREFVKAAGEEGDFRESCLDEARDELMKRRQTRRNKPMY